jgi:hypothetical protein
MSRQQIIEKLYKNHNEFIDYLMSLPDEEFMFSYKNKWTAAQQLDHIIRCVKPLTLIFRLPKFLIRLRFGKANRNSKSYDQFVSRYEEISAKGTNPPQRFIPESINPEQRNQLVQSLTKSLNKLCREAATFKEKELDTLILPHPMFGKLTFREMLYFTIHHVKHHEEITKRNLRREENYV